MTWQPEQIPTLIPDEFPALLAADGRTRYRYFATKLIDNGWVCTWGDDTGVNLWEDSDGNETVPFWPHPDYAAAECAAGQPSDGPIFYRLDHILEVTYPHLLAHRLHAGIFPVNSVFGVVLSPREFGDVLDGILARAIIFTR